MSNEIQVVADAIGDVAQALDHLPEPIKRNLWTAVGALITGIVDVPASYLEMKAAEFEVRKRGHEQIMLAAAHQAANLAGHKPELGERALEYFANDLIKGQANREAVAREAVQAAKTLPPPAHGAEVPPIDDDWLDQFRRLASSKSNAEIQAILGRILAGEAQKPGSFSPITLDVIAKLDQNIARAFEQIASLVIIPPDLPDIIVSSIIEPDMIKIGQLLDTMALRHLQSYGLLNASFGQSFNPQYFLNLPPSTLGGEIIMFSACEIEKGIGNLNLMPPMNGEVWPLSLPAMQILPLITKAFNRDYARRLRDGMKRLGVALTFPNIDIDGDLQRPDGTVVS